MFLWSSWALVSDVGWVEGLAPPSRDNEREEGLESVVLRHPLEARVLAIDSLAIHSQSGAK